MNPMKQKGSCLNKTAGVGLLGDLNRVKFECDTIIFFFFQVENKETNYVAL